MKILLVLAPSLEQFQAVKDAIQVMNISWKIVYMSIGKSSDYIHHKNRRGILLYNTNQWDDNYHEWAQYVLSSTKKEERIVLTHIDRPINLDELFNQGENDERSVATDQQ